MSDKKENLSFEMREMEKWLRKLYLDPLTSYLDDTTFRVDIFETDKEYIIEAMLTDYESDDISVCLTDKHIEIKANQKENATKETKLRIIDFPFKVINKEVRANFSKGILEIYISKEHPGSGKDRYISIC